MNPVFDLLILHGQIAITTPDVEYPFNHWEERHVNQGFVWRHESVCFGIDDSDSGVLHVEIEQSEEIHMRSWAQRVILVPFSVPESGIVEIAAIGESHEVNIETRTNTLLFQYGIDNERTQCLLSFLFYNDPKPEILRADHRLSSTSHLYMDGQPAI